MDRTGNGKFDVPVAHSEYIMSMRHAMPSLAWHYLGLVGVDE